MPTSNAQGGLLASRLDVKLIYPGFGALIHLSAVFISLFSYSWLFNPGKLLTSGMTVLYSWLFYIPIIYGKKYENRKIRYVITGNFWC